MEKKVTWEDAREQVLQIKTLFKEKENNLLENPSRKAAEDLVAFALKTNSSIYYSEILERYYLQLAEDTKEPSIPKMVHSRSVLHVMTTSHVTGGHTRIVERWIASAVQGEQHSVILIKQRSDEQIPTLLQELVLKTGGELSAFDSELSIETKANQLRLRALSSEYIVLHHDMADPVPLMAFGVCDFDRPVIVFNHAAHLFWIGRNATDIVLDVTESQNVITTEKRGLKNSLIACLPYEESNNAVAISKQKLRQKHGLPPDAHIIISMAAGYKYTTVLDFNYPDMLAQILEQDENSIVIIIGVSSSKRNSPWNTLEMKYPKRVFLLGWVPYLQMKKYLKAADLYLDSYPYNSFTSILDAVSIGKLPALSLLTPIGTQPFLSGSNSIVESQAEMVKRSLELLNNPSKSRALCEELQERIASQASLTSFQEKVQESYRLVKCITKDDSRFIPLKNSVSDFDILSNALNKRRDCIEKKSKKILKLKVYESRKGTFSLQIRLLGIPFFEHLLGNRSWETRIFGIKVHGFKIKRRIR